MIDTLTSYATATFTPTVTTNILSVSNPLGVVPKLVRVRTTDRSNSAMHDFAATEELGGGTYTASGTETQAPWTPITGSIGTALRKYLFTESAIEIQRGASNSGRWLAGVTYTVHIYA